MSSSATGTEQVVRTVGGKAVRLERGDLTALSVDAIVFYAREDLELGSGFGTAIQSRGGPAIKGELARIGRVAMGEAVLTAGGSLQARHIIHACGPKFQEADLEAKLRRTVASVFDVATGAGLASVAFPAMGAGFYGVPLALCATVMWETVSSALARESSLAEVIFCVADDREFRAFQAVMEAAREERS